MCDLCGGPIALDRQEPMPCYRTRIEALEEIHEDEGREGAKYIPNPHRPLEMRSLIHQTRLRDRRPVRVDSHHYCAATSLTDGRGRRVPTHVRLTTCQRHSGEGRRAGGRRYGVCTYTVDVTVRMTISVVVEAGRVVITVSVMVRVVCVTVTVCAATAASARSSSSRFSVDLLAPYSNLPLHPFPIHVPFPPNAACTLPRKGKIKHTSRIMTPRRARLRRPPPPRNLPVRARPRNRRLDHHGRYSTVVSDRLRRALAAGGRDGRGGYN